MNVVDSSAWLSYFADDKNAESFAVPIEALDDLLVPSITMTEVFKNVMHQRSEEMALTAVVHMEQGRVIALDEELGINAAYLGSALKLPLADSVIYATAQKHAALLWTQDADFKGLQGVQFYPRAKTSKK